MNSRSGKVDISLDLCTAKDGNKPRVCIDNMLVSAGVPGNDNKAFKCMICLNGIENTAYNMLTRQIKIPEE
jgi:hypothetical protein